MKSNLSDINGEWVVPGILLFIIRTCKTKLTGKEEKISTYLCLYIRMWIISIKLTGLQINQV